MDYVAFNYFETPSEGEIEAIASVFIRPDFALSNAGKNDPPKKFNGGVNELTALIMSGTDQTNYTFLKSYTAKIGITIEIHSDPRWEHSTISLSGPGRELIEKLCVSLNSSINSYLCISGELDAGSSQEWIFLYQDESCPRSVLDRVSKA